MRFSVAIGILFAVSATCSGASFDLATERAAARAAGLPLNPAEFHRVRPPASQDAAPLYAKLDALLKERPMNSPAASAIPSATWKSGSFTPRQMKAIQQMVASRRDIYALVHRIAARRTAWFPHRWTNDESFWYANRMRFCAQWIRWETVALAGRGRLMDAVRNQALTFRIADHAAADPGMITYLDCQAAEAIGLSGFEYLLACARGKANVRRAIAWEVEAYRPSRDLVMVFRGETLFGVTEIHSLHNANDVRVFTGVDSEDKSTPELSKGPASPIFLATFRDPNEATYLHWMTRYARATHMSGNLRSIAFAKAGKDFEAAKKTTDYLFSLIVIPALGNVTVRDEAFTARRAVLVKAAMKD